MVGMEQRRMRGVAMRPERKGEGDESTQGVPNGNSGIISNEEKGTTIGFVLGKANKTTAPEEPVL